MILTPIMVRFFFEIICILTAAKMYTSKISDTPLSPDYCISSIASLMAPLINLIFMYSVIKKNSKTSKCLYFGYSKAFLFISFHIILFPYKREEKWVVNLLWRWQGADIFWGGGVLKKFLSMYFQNISNFLMIFNLFFNKHSAN